MASKALGERIGELLVSAGQDPLLDLKCEESGEILGRLFVPNWDWEEGAFLTHQGLVTGRIKGLVGVTQSNNGSDLLRSNATPLGKFSDWNDWVKRFRVSEFR
jgi:hypothetical protein